MTDDPARNIEVSTRSEWTSRDASVAPQTSEKDSKTQRATLTGDSRGTLWTVEAFLFLTLILAGLVLAATLLPANDSREQFDDAQRQQITNDILTTGDATGALTNSTLFWDATEQRFVGADTAGPSSEHYTALSTHPSHPLWPLVNLSLTQRHLAYNIHIEYNSGGGSVKQQPVVQQGPPGRNALTVSRSIVVQDDDTPELATTSDNGDLCTLGEMGNETTSGTNGCTNDAFFAPDANPSGPRYNVLTVSITVWNK